MSFLIATANTILTTGSHEGLKALLLQVLFAIIILGIVAGLIWCIERWINKAPLPYPWRLIIAGVMVICVLLWAISNFL